MIRNAQQLKAKILNLTHGDSRKSQIYLRNFFMERFLERISVSSFQDNFILKGGLLVTSLVGLDLRATMDIDSTVKGMPLNEKETVEIIQSIIKEPLSDQVNLILSRSSTIKGELDYPGLRFSIQGIFDGIRQAIRIDLSTDEIITPGAVSYNYRLMFEDRSIHLMTYNLGTLIAEKFETMITRGAANTRMRDFYDIFLFAWLDNFDHDTLRSAITNTVSKRSSKLQLEDYRQIMQEVASSSLMEAAWEGFKRQSYFVDDLSWEEVVRENILLADKVLAE